MKLEPDLGIAPARVQPEHPERPPVILRRWSYSLFNPEQLVGNVYNHPNPRIADGKRIRTSRLLWLREDLGLAQTLNTLYVLRDQAG